MTTMVVNPEHQEQVDTAVQRLAHKLRLELNLDKPEYEAIMESKEAFSRIRQLLMAMCELYALKEELWQEVTSLGANLTTERIAILDSRHQPINETIYQRIIEINYLTRYLSAEQLNDVDGYIDQIQPQLQRCVPRMSKPTHLFGSPYDDPQTWYQPCRCQLSTAVERAASDVIAVTAESWAVAPDTKRRTRTPKFA